jgi:hypothetical protein
MAQWPSSCAVTESAQNSASAPPFRKSWPAKKVFSSKPSAWKKHAPHVQDTPPPSQTRKRRRGRPGQREAASSEMARMSSKTRAAPEPLLSGMKSCSPDVRPAVAHDQNQSWRLVVSSPGR